MIAKPPKFPDDLIVGAAGPEVVIRPRIAKILLGLLHNSTVGFRGLDPEFDLTVAALHDIAATVDAQALTPISVDGRAEEESDSDGVECSRQLLLSRQAAAVLGITQHRLRQLVRQGVVVPVNRGPYLFDPADIEALKEIRSGNDSYADAQGPEPGRW